MYYEMMGLRSGMSPGRLSGGWLAESRVRNDHLPPILQYSITSLLASYYRIGSVRA